MTYLKCYLCWKTSHARFSKFINPLLNNSWAWFLKKRVCELKLCPSYLMDRISCKSLAKLWYLQHDSFIAHVYIALLLVALTSARFYICNSNQISTDTEYHSLVHIWYAVIELIKYLIFRWYVFIVFLIETQLPPSSLLPSFTNSMPWASCHIHKIAGCACAGNARDVSPATAD